VSIGDILLFTALVAGIVAAFYREYAPIGFITASLLGIFLWHRPVGAKLWAIAMLGLGTGLFASGFHGGNRLVQTDSDAVGWGAGIAVGSLAYLVVNMWRRET
jgi:hypothetical protein